MGRLINGVIYNVQCRDCETSFERCAKIIDARCVIYLGESNLPNIPALKGDDLEFILENFNIVIGKAYSEFQRIKKQWDEFIESSYKDIEHIKKVYENAKKKVDYIENNFCEIARNCVK